MKSSRMTQKQAVCCSVLTSLYRISGDAGMSALPLLFLDPASSSEELQSPTLPQLGTSPSSPVRLYSSYAKGSKDDSGQLTWHLV